MNKTDIIGHFNKLNKRTLGIVAALALPVVLLAVVIHTGAPRKPAIMANAVRPHPTLEQAREQVKNRLAQVQKTPPAQWPEERRKYPWIAQTWQQAINYNTNRLAQLNAMTPAQWEAQFHPQPAPRPQPKMQQKSALDVIPAPITKAKQANLPPTSR